MKNSAFKDISLEEFANVVETINILRSENGCKWDREQTHSSLKHHILEESYEMVDAIDENDIENLKEELGDVLLQVLLHCQIAKEDRQFDINDVCKVLNEKLIRRHPHVFANIQVENCEQIIENWDKIKKEEKKGSRKSILDGVSKSQPALMSALKLSKKACRANFDWENEAQLRQCIKSEFEEFDLANSFDEKEEEFGDILFSLVNLARINNIDPELALLKANKKFSKRFRIMENLSKKPFNTHSIEEFDDLWKQAKQISKFR